MRAGRLRQRVSIRQLSGHPPVASDVTQVWADVRPPAKDGNLQSSGLRAAAPTPVICRYTSLIRADMYLVDGAHLYHIDGVNDRDARERELWLACTELAGDPATYTPAAGGSYPLRAALIKGLVYVGEYGQVASVRSRIELPWLELAAPPGRGDQITLKGTTYTVQSLAEGGDDGVTVQVVV